eukprot:CCRYP_006876-RC/>CCRYP_006876-RC protein AED:0.19 eAED:0.19 QI:1563/1/1/1/1/0.75/4/978/205
MYQQYELQQRHAHQMQMLQETQRRLMAVEHQRLSSHHQQQITHPLVMPLNMIESHEISEDYSIPSTIAMTPSLSAAAYPPASLSSVPLPPPPMGYPYSPPSFPGLPMLSSPMTGMLLPGGEQEMHHNKRQHNQEQQERSEPPSNATIISPPMSPERFGHPEPQPPVAYTGGSLLYFDQSGIPLTGMQERNDPDKNEELCDENTKF